ncbi:MAG: HIT domain-containing protein [Kiritimatiellia bacterium]|nr:HIT domain-containing protein [Kiritimatiellia bacterium]
MADDPNPEREALWAPWRMDYILGPKSDACFLCEAAAAEDPRRPLVLCRRGPVFLLLNRYPYNNGHLMVCPVRHVKDLSDLNTEERLGLMNLADEAIRSLRLCLAPQGFNLGINMGHVAGAGLDSHLHLHIVPRWSGDTNFMPVIADTKVIPQALDDTWKKLRAVLEPS